MTRFRLQRSGIERTKKLLQDYYKEFRELSYEMTPRSKKETEENFQLPSEIQENVFRMMLPHLKQVNIFSSLSEACSIALINHMVPRVFGSNEIVVRKAALISHSHPPPHTFLLPPLSIATCLVYTNTPITYTSTHATLTPSRPLAHRTLLPHSLHSPPHQNTCMLCKYTCQHS